MKLNKQQIIRMLSLIEHLVESDDIDMAIELYGKLRPSLNSCKKWATAKQKKILKIIKNIGD